ncbi:g5615 [Coccomyxa elongata]
MHGQRVLTQCLRTARGLCPCLASQHTTARFAGGCQGQSKPSTKVGWVQRRHAQEMASGSEKMLEAEYLSTEDAQPCSTSSLTKSSTPAFLARKGVLNARGQLMLKSLTYTDLEQWCISVGERPQRARQLWKWMYYDGGWVRSLDDTADLQDGLSAAFREQWRDRITVDGGLRLRSVHKAADGTRKMVFDLQDSPEAAGAGVEAVIIPVERPGASRPRTTLCVSSQVGCAQNCQFCFTGRMGLRVQLSAAQIVEQVVEARRHVAEHNRRVAAGELPAAAPLAPISNIVFMGMGEPLHNFEAVGVALEVLCHPQGLQLSPNKVTVSTVGLVPQMRALAARSAVQLAVSLHATTDEVRSWIVPLNRRYPLAELIGALEELYPKNAAVRPRVGRHVLFEYVLLRGVNDSLEDAERLIQLTSAIECKVNLILFNPHAGTPFKASHQEQVLAFQAVLKAAGVLCTVRDSRGDDEMAACGQLGNIDELNQLAPMLKPPLRFKDALVAA